MMLQQIKETFGDCKFSGTSNCNNCDEKISYITVIDKQFFVYDSKEKEPVQIVSEGSHQLEVINNTEEDVTLIKTDDCLFNTGTKKCDCIVLNEKQCFLVEIKSSSIGTSGKKRKKAAEQLGVTIEYLLQNGINLTTTHLVEAIICFKRDKTNITQASANTNRAIFLDKYNIDLREGNQITFKRAVPVPEDGTGNGPDTKVE